jgi:hypothetical protein
MKKITWIVIATLLALAIGCWWYLMDAGFCFSQLRYLNDKELIVEAIRYNAANMQINGTSESIEEFLKQNPKCCYVDRHPSSRKFLEPLAVCLGFNYSEVTLNYKQSKPHSVSEPFYENYISISACGANPRSVYGTSHSTLQTIN